MGPARTMLLVIEEEAPPGAKCARRLTVWWPKALAFLGGEY